MRQAHRMTVSESDEVSAIASRMAQALAAKGWSQGELARRANIRPETVSRYLAGENRPRTKEALAIAKALAVTTDWLLTGAEALTSLDDGYEAAPGDLETAVAVYKLEPSSEAALRNQRWSGGPPVLEDLLARARTLKAQEVGKVPDLGLEAKGKASDGEQGL